MSEQERIAKLRDGTWDHTIMRGPNPTGFCVDETPFAKATADRIEELVMERDENDALAAKYMNLAEVLEAKLTKTVEALRFYAPKTFGGITFVGDDAGKRAAAVLAELEGKE